MAEKCANCGKGREKGGKKLPVCSRCQSRAYCGAKCQQEHWKTFHKSECKQLKKQRAEMEAATGVPPTRGVPAVMNKKNMQTGKSAKHMVRPTTRDHQMANVRQSIASLLDTLNKDHSTYVCAAAELSLAFGQIEFDNMKDFFKDRPASSDPFEIRMFVGYMASEFNVLVAITKKFQPGPALRRQGIFWGVNLSYDGSGTIGDGPAPRMDAQQFVSEAQKDPPIRKLVLPYVTGLNCELNAFRSVIAGPSGPTLEHINLIGTASLIDDSILELMAQRCPNLEFLVFGQDNRYYPPDDITIVGLSKLASSCKKLRFLRILHRCKTLDSSDPNGLICNTLKREGFTLRFIPEAEEQKKGLAMDLEGDFWRADVEDGLMSASWYERFESNQQQLEFFAKHFSHWM